MATRKLPREGVRSLACALASPFLRRVRAPSEFELRDDAGMNPVGKFVRDMELQPVSSWKEKPREVADRPRRAACDCLPEVTGRCITCHHELEQATRRYSAQRDRRLHRGASPLLVAQSEFALGLLLEERGRIFDALELYRRVLCIRRSKLGDAHPDTVLTARAITASTERACVELGALFG